MPTIHTWTALNCQAALPGALHGVCPRCWLLVLLPSSTSPLTCFEWAELFRQASPPCSPQEVCNSPASEVLEEYGIIEQPVSRSGDVNPEQNKETAKAFYDLMFNHCR